MEYLEEYSNYVKGLTVAERIKFITVYEWAGAQKPSPEEAIASSKKQCSPDEIGKRHEPGNLSFESELAAIEAIKSIAQLSDEEAQKLENDVFTQSSISSEIANKIKTAFEELGTEAKLVDALVGIHDNWVKNHANNFQKPGRDKNYQFVDLRLMSFNKDGASADLIFIQPILEACGIHIDITKLQEAFEEAQKLFLEEKNIHSHDDLLRHIQGGSTTYAALEDLKAYDGILIDDYLNGSAGVSVAPHMAEQVEDRSGITFSRYEAKNFEGFKYDGQKTEEDIASQEKPIEPKGHEQ